MSGTKAVTGVLAFAALSVAAGCAGNQPVPSASIDQAEQRIDEAERSDAQRYANRELNMAREKLLQAREALEDGDEERAARLAEHAELDAAYAIALADSQSAQDAVEELRATLSTLEGEIERQQERSGLSEGGDVDVSLGDDVPRAPRDTAPRRESEPLGPIPGSEPGPEASDEALPGRGL